MKQLLRLLWRGKGLRYLPIAAPNPGEPLVRFELRTPDGDVRDVSADHVPVSLQPMTLGVWSDGPRSGGGATAARSTLVVRDHRTGTQLGSIELTAAGTLPLTRGTLSLFTMGACRNTTVPVGVRWSRYALAWRHAQLAQSRGDGLCLSAAELRSLNVYYTAPRPVYLMGVAHGDRANLFPMDLVGRVGSGDYLLALRATSRPIELIKATRVIAMSAAPAEHFAHVYTLGAHHRTASVDLSGLPFSVQRSPLRGLPILAQGLTRELTVTNVHRVGSYNLFDCRVDAESGTTTRALALVSAMHAEWLARRGRPLDTLA